MWGDHKGGVKEALASLEDVAKPNNGTVFGRSIRGSAAAAECFMVDFNVRALLTSKSADT